MSEPKTQCSDAAHLVPKSAPGRSSRKARGFGHQIRELQARGYTLATIREALAELGIVVSKSTVQREAARLTRGVAVGHPPFAVRSGPAVDDSEHATTSPAPGAPARPSVPSPVEADHGKDVAAAFMKDRITNPLISAKNRAEEQP